MRQTIIKKCVDPKILVITPLRIGDKVSHQTKVSINRNKTPFVHVIYEDDNNPALNTSNAYEWYRKEYGKVPPYMIKIDNDLDCSRGMIDKMYNILENVSLEIAYAYCSFEFVGHIQYKFPVQQFNETRLRSNNYISSCSLLRTDALDDVGGFIVDNKYNGLLDWALWLKLLNKNYIGTPCEGYFSAQSSPTSVSSWPNGNYKQVHSQVTKDFC